MKYKPKPRFDSGFLAREEKNGAGSLIGRLLPQPKVRSGDRAALLDDFLGNNFALLSLPQTPASVFDRLSGDLWPSLRCQRVAIRPSGDFGSLPNGVTGVLDAGGELTDAVKNLPPGLLLIRPDRYVAAFLPAANLDRNVREVDEMIAQTWK
jgi:3-(3-hydroxy-phenyl)propionate hydroxylase